MTQFNTQYLFATQAHGCIEVVCVFLCTVDFQFTVLFGPFSRLSSTKLRPVRKMNRKTNGKSFCRRVFPFTECIRY